MPTADDAGNPVSDPLEQLKKPDAADTASNEDWHKRYNGQTGLINKLKEQSSTAVERYEAELADIRAKHLASETEKATAVKAAADAARERDALKERLEGRDKADVLKKEYPNLDEITLAAISPKSFADEAAYKAHLKTLNDKLAGVATPAQVPSPPADEKKPEDLPGEYVGYRTNNYLEQLAGILPNSPSQPGQTKGGGKRTPQQIQADMERLNTKTQDGQQKFDAFIREMDSVLSS